MARGIDKYCNYDDKTGGVTGVSVHNEYFHFSMKNIFILKLVM